MCESPRPNEAKLPGNIFYISLKRGDIKLPYGERIKFLTYLQLKICSIYL